MRVRRGRFQTCPEVPLTESTETVAKRRKKSGSDAAFFYAEL